MDFGKYLKELRENAGLTQDEAANKMGVSTTSVQNWEYNNNLPEIDNLNALAKTYNIALTELISILDKSLNKTNNNKQEERKLPYEDLLSDEFNIDKIKSLDFTNKEIDIFVGFALNISLNNNPLPTLFQQTKSSMEASLFIDKIKDLELIIYETKDVTITKTNYGNQFVISDYINYYPIQLSNAGRYLLDLIKSNTYFNIYSLKISELFMLAKNFNLINNLDEKLELLQFIHEKKSYCIKTVESNNEESLIEYPLEKYTENKNIAFINRLPLILEADYYELIKEESSDNEYLAAKEIYLKKLKVYKANKELLDDMNEPTFNEVYVEYVKLSKKGEKLYNALEECAYYNQ